METNKFWQSGMVGGLRLKKVHEIILNLLVYVEKGPKRIL